MNQIDKNCVMYKIKINFCSRYCWKGFCLVTKGVFTLPVYACVYRIALHFFITYLGLLISMAKKVITSKTHRNAENACRNRMWQLGLKKKNNVWRRRRNDERKILIWEKTILWQASVKRIELTTKYSDDDEGDGQTKQCFCFSPLFIHLWVT